MSILQKANLTPTEAIAMVAVLNGKGLVDVARSIGIPPGKLIAAQVGASLKLRQLADKAENQFRGSR